jgi:hypothetical protein
MTPTLKPMINRLPVSAMKISDLLMAPTPDLMILISTPGKFIAEIEEVIASTQPEVSHLMTISSLFRGAAFAETGSPVSAIAFWRFVFFLL